MPYLDNCGARIHYQVWPSERPGLTARWVTLINGYTRPLNDFRTLGKRLNEAGCHVLVLDNRGCGETTSNEAFTAEQMAGDVGALWREVGCQSTSLLGISMGGMIAQRCALKFGKTVEKLILVSTASRQVHIHGSDEPWVADFHKVYERMTQYFHPHFLARNEGLAKAMSNQIVKKIEEGSFAVGAEQQRAAVANFDCFAELGGVTIPTLVIHGQDDRIIDQEAAHEMAQALPNAEVVLLPNIGHLLLAEAPQKLARQILDFL